MAKKLAGTMKLQVPAGQANPSPPVGPALGPRGINLLEFCQAFTDKTLTSLPALEAELETIRAQGYSFDDEEKTTGMRCVAAPVRDASGLAVAGLSVSGPTSRMTDAAIPRIATQVVAAARSLSESLGA